MHTHTHTQRKMLNIVVSQLWTLVMNACVKAYDELFLSVLAYRTPRIFFLSHFLLTRDKREPGPEFFAKASGQVIAMADWADEEP